MSFITEHEKPNCGIVGLPANGGVVEDGWWPTEGYDGGMAGWGDGDGLAGSAYSREQWLALADEMIARWHVWKAHIESLP